MQPRVVLATDRLITPIHAGDAFKLLHSCLGRRFHQRGHDAYRGTLRRPAIPKAVEYIVQPATLPPAVDFSLGWARQRWKHGDSDRLRDVVHRA